MLLRVALAALAVPLAADGPRAHGKQKMSDDSAGQPAAPIAALFSDAWSRLPPAVQRTLTDTLTGRPLVSLAANPPGAAIPDAGKFCSVTVDQSGLELARFQPEVFGRGGTIGLNASLLAHYTPEDPTRSPVSCRHGSLHSEVLAAVLHEFAHAYEREAARRRSASHSPPLPVPSSDERYLRIADFVPGWFSSTNKNTSPLRSPDLYEIRSAQESFAVGFEYFLLDTNFACRRPSISSYLVRAFGFDPFPSRGCRTNEQAFVMAEAPLQLRDLDPSRIYRVDYLMASPGTRFVSRWGHSMLRLVVCAPALEDTMTGLSLPAAPVGPGCAENTFYHLVVSYRADLRGFAPGIWSLIADRFPSRLFLLTFDEVFREYLYGDLRDLVAYPIALSEDEKRALIHKILESYWGYEGDYHFIGNNCATETRDLLASIKAPPQAKSASTALTPTGLREDWSAFHWIDTTPAKTYPSLLPVLERIWNEQAILTGPHLSSDAKAQTVIVKHMRESRARSRWKVLQEKLAVKTDTVSVVRDFVVMEAQILRFQEQLLKDDVFSLGRQKAPSLFKVFETDLLSRMDKTVGGAYGIPLASEIMSESENSAAAERFKNSLDALKQALQADLAERSMEIEATRDNLRKAFSQQRSSAILDKRSTGSMRSVPGRNP